MTDELKMQSLDPSHHTFFLHILFKFLITVLGAQMKFYIVVKQITAKLKSFLIYYTAFYISANEFLTKLCSCI